MKRKLIILAAVMIPALLIAQQSPVERVFQKYAGVAGITSVQISSGMFSMLAGMDSGNDELQKLASGISLVYILHAPENTGKTMTINFYDEVLKDLPVEKYNELMRINSSDQQVLILADEKNGFIKELLLLAGGGDDNALIYIKGNIELKQIASLSNMNAPGMEHFQKMQK